MKSQALGRGLDALLGEMDEAYENEGSNKELVLEISLEDIKPNPFQPRKIFDDNALMELAESIKKDGLIQPIVVKEDIDGYTLIAGERRLRASKLANMPTIRAILFNNSDEKMRQFALIENIQREELNAIELANAYNELLKLHNITQEELSAVIHKSRTHITNTIRLLQLSPITQKALLDKKISAGHAKVLVGLDDKQQELIVNSIIGQKLSVREVEAIIKNIKNDNSEKNQITQKSKSVVYDFSIAKEKLGNLGFNTKGNSNKLTIEFHNEEDIEAFLSYFND